MASDMSGIFPFFKRVCEKLLKKTAHHGQRHFENVVLFFFRDAVAICSVRCKASLCFTMVRPVMCL